MVILNYSLTRLYPHFSSGLLRPAEGKNTPWLWHSYMAVACAQNMSSPSGKQMSASAGNVTWRIIPNLRVSQLLDFDKIQVYIVGPHDLTSVRFNLRLYEPKTTATSEHYSLLAGDSFSTNQYTR